MTTECIFFIGATGGLKWYYSRGKVSELAPLWYVGTYKQAQGRACEGLHPEGISPRLRARLLAVTCSRVVCWDRQSLRARMLAVACEMSLFASIV